MSQDSQQDQYRDNDDDDDDDVQPSEESDVSSISLSEESPDDDDDDEDYGNGKRKKPSQHRLMKQNQPKKKLKKNRFVEEEAEEASEEEDDGEEDVVKKYELKEKEWEKKQEELMRQKPRQNIIKNLEERFKDNPDGEDDQDQYDVDGLESHETDIEPPKNDEPKIWRVNCNRGKENDAAMSLMFKYNQLRDSENKLEIVSSFALRKFPGAIFVEANFEWQVQKAVEGVYDLRSMGIEMLLDNQCIQLFTPMEQEPIPIEIGQWVRVKNQAIYNGDLAKVLDINEQKRTCTLKLIPREKRELKAFATSQQEKDKIKKGEKTEKGQKGEFKGEEMEFQDEEPKQGRQNKWALRAKQIHLEQRKFVRGPKIPLKQDKPINLSLREDQSQYYYTDTVQERQKAKSEGFFILHTSVTNVKETNVKPTLEELTYFYPDVKDIASFVARLQKSLKVGSASQFKVDDKVQLINDPTGVRFTLKEIHPDGKVILWKQTKDKNSNEIHIYQQTSDLSQIQIAFSKYQTVNINAGLYAGNQGIIIELQKKNTATISTDSGKVIECQLADLTPVVKVQGYDQSINSNPFKAQQGSQQTNIGSKDKSGITRYDLVRFGPLDTDVGCVLSVQNDDLTVLDLTNKVKIIKLVNITANLQTRNNVAKNKHRHDIRQRDLVVVLDGFYKDCKPTVIHVYRDSLFLHSGKFDHTQGIIVEKANVCALISSVSSGPQKQFPSSKKGGSNDTTSGQDAFKNMIGQYITISRGQWSGYRGMVLQVNPKTVEIQLTAKNLKVKVIREDLLQGETQTQTQAGKTPHYVPQHQRWGEEQDPTNRAYMSPYAYNTPLHHDYQ